MNCTSCGGRLQEGANFCALCAHPVRPSLGSTGPGSPSAGGGSSGESRGRVVPSNVGRVVSAAVNDAARVGDRLPSNADRAIGGAEAVGAGSRLRGVNGDSVRARGLVTFGAFVVLLSLLLPWVSCAGVNLRGVDLVRSQAAPQGAAAPRSQASARIVDTAAQDALRQAGTQLGTPAVGLVWLVPLLGGVILVLAVAGLGRSARKNSALTSAILMSSAAGAAVCLAVILGVLYQKATLGQSLFGRMVAQAIGLQVGGFVGLAGFALCLLGGTLQQATQEDEDD